MEGHLTPSGKTDERQSPHTDPLNADNTAAAKQQDVNAVCQASPADAQAESHALATATETYFRTQGIIFVSVTALLLAAGFIISLVAAGPLLPFAFGLLVWIFLLAGLVFYLPHKKWLHRRWRFDEQGIFISQGIWWRKQFAVPRSRLQHIDVNQGPLQRTYGIAELVLHTAGATNAKVSLLGLTYAQAVAIRDELLYQDESDAV